MGTSELWALTTSFLKIGLFSLGGGNSMLQLIEHECVTKHQWVSKIEFGVITGSTFIFPGLTAVKISALIGFKVAGMLGMIIAVLCINVPGIILVLLFYVVIKQNQDKPFVKNLIQYVQYGGVTLLAAAVYDMMKPLLAQNYSLRLCFLSGLFFISVTLLRFSPFYGLLIFLLACFISG
jgi:chromate transporter